MSAFAGPFGVVEITAVIVFGVVAAFVVGGRFPPQHRLIWWPLMGERSADRRVRANRYMLENAGRAAADDIEIRLSFPPARVELSPAVSYGTRPDTGGRVLTIARLGAGQRLGLRVEAGAGAPPHILEVWWRDGLAEQRLESWRRAAGSAP